MPLQSYSHFSAIPWYQNEMLSYSLPFGSSCDISTLPNKSIFIRNIFRLFHHRMSGQKSEVLPYLCCNTIRLYCNNDNLQKVINRNNLDSQLN